MLLRDILEAIWKITGSLRIDDSLARLLLVTYHECWLFLSLKAITLANDRLITMVNQQFFIPLCSIIQQKVSERIMIENNFSRYVMLFISQLFINVF